MTRATSSALSNNIGHAPMQTSSEETVVVISLWV